MESKRSGDELENMFRQMKFGRYNRDDTGGLHHECGVFLIYATEGTT